MQFNISFKTIFEYILKKLVLCIQIRFVSTEKTTRIASRASCFSIGATTYNIRNPDLQWQRIRHEFPMSSLRYQ